MRWFHKIIYLSGLLALTNFAHAENPTELFQPVKQKLIAAGIDSTQVYKIFADPRVQFKDELIQRNMVPNDHPANYQGFLSDQQVEDGLEFFYKWQDELETLVGNSNIPPEIVIAILKIESNLGKRPGHHGVFSSLATLAALNNPELWRHFADTSEVITYTQLEKRARKRSDWAFKELLALLEASEDYHWDPLALEGSWAGAFGWAQFLPTSYIHYGRDGNGDQRIEPNNLYDAVAGLVNYLVQARWSTSKKSQRKALHRYNPSNAYVDCILTYSEKLKSRLKNTVSDTP